MSKTTWIILAVVVAAAAGGGTYYIMHQQTIEVPVQAAPVTTTIPTDAPKAPAEDLTNKKIDGIGSTRNLKPVPIPQGPAR